MTRLDDVESEVFGAFEPGTPSWTAGVVGAMLSLGTPVLELLVGAGVGVSMAYVTAAAIMTGLFAVLAETERGVSL